MLRLLLARVVFFMAFRSLITSANNYNRSHQIGFIMVSVMLSEILDHGTEPIMLQTAIRSSKRYISCQCQVTVAEVSYRIYQTILGFQ